MSSKIQNIIKVIRYIRIYGVVRTFIKVQGTRHLKSKEKFPGKFWMNNSRRIVSSKQKVAVIGCGYYSFSVIGYYLFKNFGAVIKYAVDQSPERALSFSRYFRSQYASIDVDSVLQDEDIKLIYIATNHASHAEYAARCIKTGKSVHIEKPHVVNLSQLRDLMSAVAENPKAKIFLGFNRTKSDYFEILRKKLDEQTGSMVLNWFVVGHSLDPNHWYYDEKEGGRILGNLCHWSDATLNLVGIERAFPITITPGLALNSGSEYIVSLKFNDGSGACITFSAKGATPTGVVEKLNIQKGDVIANITDFDNLQISDGKKTTMYKSFVRDHGHSKNILNSLHRVNMDADGEPLEYIQGTALLFLGIKHSLTTGKVLKLVNQLDQDF